MKILFNFRLSEVCLKLQNLKNNGGKEFVSSACLELTTFYTIYAYVGFMLFKE